ncbi:MAG: Uma2 family endonuclease [Planctomycetota bacterium]
MTPLPDSRTKLTYADYDRISNDDGRRHEIIDGEHIVNAAPAPRHQQISFQLQLQLYEQIQKRGNGEVYGAPVGVRFSNHDIVEPDLIAIRSENLGIITPTLIDGAPDLLVEILSPSSAATDRIRKLALYERFQVSEYWIVDPESRVVEQYVLTAGVFELKDTCRETITCLTFIGVSLNLTVVWR